MGSSGWSVATRPIKSYKEIKGNIYRGGQYLLHQELVGGVGVAEAVGAPGAVGAAGAIGAVGAAGATEAVGAAGATGAAGAVGATGG